MAPASSFRGGVDPLALLDCLNPSNRHAFLRPTPAIPAASLQFVKNTLEGFAGTVSDEQQQRIKEINRKRKRSERVPLNSTEVLKLRRIHVEGFETGQVWQQAKRIIADTLKHSNEAVRELEEANQVAINGVETHDQDSDLEESAGEHEDDSAEEEDLNGDGYSKRTQDMSGSDEELANGLDDEDWTEDEDDGEDLEDEPETTYQDDVHGLNDGFFSIDEFNRQSQWFEDQDAKGDPYTDQVSDDEEVDWNADPFAKPNKSAKPSKPGKSGRPRDDIDDLDAQNEDEDGMDLDLEGLEDDGADEDEDEDDDGPTFGDMDLYAPEGASDDEGVEDAEEAEQEESNANDFYYKDFFAPPPRKSQACKEQTQKQVRFEKLPEDDENLELAMASVKRDLFDVISDEEDSLSDASAGDPKSRRSAHERRQAKISEDIRKLEAAALAKRDWALSGEVSAAQRPQHSLLEQDLDFEFIGKPAPVITTEVTESIEEMIKRRILANEFDDVVRRQPDDAAVDTRRGLVEVDDKKSKKGLAELYEEDHLKAQQPDTYVSKSDEKLQKEEKEVERMWKDLSAKLDSLSNWHFKPKPAAPSLTVVSDIATISMEDAQPTTAQGISGGQSMLAPQEIYKAGKESTETGEVVSKSGLPVAKQEMTREQKKRRRRREKERQHKSSGQKDAQASKKSKMRKDTIADLKKGGVKVINKKGEVVDVDGKKARAAAPTTGRSVKL